MIGDDRVAPDMARSRLIGRGSAPVAVLLFLLGGCSRRATESAPPAAAAVATAGAPASGTPYHVVAGRVPAARGGMAAIVILEPRTPREFPPQAEKPFMDQISQTFFPAVLFVRTGQPTEFRNGDDVLHNVRVREQETKEGTFNVAIPTGQVYIHTFPRDGFYDVGCDIHPGMSAQIVATSTPYAVMADTEGNFVLDDIEPGSYTMVVYVGADKLKQTVEVSGARTVVNVTDP
jgi:plastocyanin